MSDCDYLEGWNNGEAHATSNHAGWPRPIPVGERLPEEGSECVLAFFAKCSIRTLRGMRLVALNSWCTALAIWHDGKFEGWDKDQEEFDEPPECVTHWLPLPPKP